MEAAALDIRTKKIVVTGGAGFLGQHVVKQLEAAGATDICVPRKRDYDLRRESDVIRLYRDSNAEIVIHLAAAVGGIGANRAHPGSFFYDNLLMGILLIEQARLCGVEKFVAIGTICAYPKFAPVPFKEDDLWNGYPEETNAPYGLAKKMLLVQSQAYREQYGMNSIYLLPVNLYGPGDNFDLETSHVIPAIIRKVIAAQSAQAAEITCWGDGSPTREFLYVEDCAEAILLATQRYNGAEPVNIGTGTEISIAALVEMICEMIGYRGQIRWDRSKPNGQPRRCLDTERAYNYFGFRARVPLAEGLARTIAWYRDYCKV